MRSLIAVLCLLPLACGGGVSSDPSNPGPSGTGTSTTKPPPPPPPAPTAKSLLCSAATIQHEDDVAVWYSSATAVTFLRHDGTRTVVHEAETDQKYMSAEAGAAGGLIGLIVTQADMPSHAYVFDRQAKLIGHQVLSQPIQSLRVSARGIAFSVVSADLTQTMGRVWDGVNAPRDLGPWSPLAAPDAEGWIPVQSAWNADLPDVNEFGFLDPEGTFHSFTSGQPGVYGVKGRLVSIDPATRILRIGRHDETKQISLAEFAQGDSEPPMIRETREEGWISIQRYQAETELSSLLVVNVETGETREVPADPGNDAPLAFYCNAGFPGFLASDGTLLRSHIANGKLEMRQDQQPFGVPLSSIAALYLHERNGTVVQVGSDGSDTYCGDNSGWPPVADTLPGNSVQIYRHGETMLGEFTASFESPVLDLSGSCALLNQYGDALHPLNVQDLERKTTRAVDVEDTAQWARWIE